MKRATSSRDKLKPTRSADMTVVRVERGGLLAYWPAGDQVVALGHRKGVEVRLGDVVEVAFEGHGSELRFARLSRVRPDITPVVPLRLAG